MAADITVLSNHNSYVTRFTYLSTTRQGKARQSYLYRTVHTQQYKLNICTDCEIPLADETIML